ncbi:MAG: acetyl-CoA carboxylase biotin carboxyl carrier protein [Alphaproteobacteria bacterium]
MSDNLDTKIVSKLAEILDKNNLTELEYEGETFRICLTRDFSSAVQAPVYAAPTPIAAPVVAPIAQAAAPVAEASKEVDFSKHAGAVKSPMVGVVYLSSSPSIPNYVEVGSSVKEGDTVCLIEAMKTFNPVKASKAGKVTKILVTSGDPVEYGEPLVIIE